MKRSMVNNRWADTYGPWEKSTKGESKALLTDMYETATETANSMELA